MASGVRTLHYLMPPRTTKIPIGLDGAVIEHLRKYYCEAENLLYVDSLPNTVEISSHYDNSDIEKFERILCSTKDPIVSVFDLRTVKGTLASTVRTLFNEWKKKSGRDTRLLFVEMFDPNGYADVQAFREPLLDNERLNWMPDYDSVKSLFFNPQGGFRREYALSHEKIAGMIHVAEIKKLI